ncbi:ThiS family protein [Pelotomaculum schinkii]|uniref:ThiS family protein n=1 Tax=Pelotomaculum schinkii TaxID=78350 RepID=A0A4Y7RF72_9FIRM|nr:MULTISPECIES: MoaD/ThiS family protein [Pelotomaculum]TEB07634.1 ThiS family protein [Pelotomaculum schinkii]TEB12660.1 ThiS family protein [Pelotomaculum sp. FP]
MLVEMKVYGEISFFIPGARHGQTFKVEVPQGATIGMVLDKLGVPRNVFGLFLNGRHVTVDKVLNEGDKVYLLEALNGG